MVNKKEARAQRIYAGMGSLKLHSSHMFNDPGFRVAPVSFVSVSNQEQGLCLCVCACNSEVPSLIFLFYPMSLALPPKGQLVCLQQQPPPLLPVFSSSKLGRRQRPFR